MPLSVVSHAQHSPVVQSDEASPMAVAFVSETWLPEINGVTHTLNQLASHLHQRSYPLQLVRPAPNDGSFELRAQNELQVKAIPVQDYEGVNIGWVTPRRLRDFWRAHRPDIVYIATEGPLGMVALRVARQLKLPVVSGFHTNFDQYSQHYLWLRWVRPFVGAFLKRFHNRTSATLVPTQRQANGMTARGYRNVKLLGRGLDHGRFSPQYRDNALRATWGATTNTCVAMHIGRLAVEKNITLLIKTLQTLREHYPEQVAVIVGEGPLRQQAEQDLPWVHFVDFQKDEALARYYASGDCFIFPSLSETFGNVVTEAMASGQCVLAFDYAAAGELITHGENGFVVPYQDERAFTEAILSLRTHSAADISAIGRHASDQVSRLTWPHVADTFIRYLHQARETHDA